MKLIFVFLLLSVALDAANSEEPEWPLFKCTSIARISDGQTVFKQEVVAGEAGYKNSQPIETPIAIHKVFGDVFYIAIGVSIIGFGSEVERKLSLIHSQLEDPVKWNVLQESVALFSFNQPIPQKIGAMLSPGKKMKHYSIYFEAQCEKI